MKSPTKHNVTVKEIAQKAGVSISTVSRVISGTDTMIPISEKTRRRVLAVCEEMQYLPDINYSRLQARRSHTIALLVQRYSHDNPHHFYFDEVIGRFMSTMESGLTELGYSILIQGVDREYEQSRQYLKILRNNTADGLVIWEAFEQAETIRRLREESRPSLCVAFPYEDAAHYIVPDNFQGAHKMTQHLLSLGHERIVFMNRGLGEIVDTLRERGYRRAMEERNLEPLIIRADYTYRGGFHAARNLFAQFKNATAVFAANDLMAIGVSHFAQHNGMKVPADVAIAGLDGSSHSLMATPRITTGRLPLEEMGQLAARHLIDLVEGKNTGAVQITLPIDLIVRESTDPGVREPNP